METANKKLLYFIAMIAALNGLLFGFDTGVISGVLLFIKKDFALSIGAESFLMIAVLVGACGSAFVSGFLADSFGRRKMLYADALLFIVGTIVCVVAGNVTELIIGRVIQGVAIGISSYVGPLYVSELAFFKSRGFLVAMFQLFITIGILLSYTIDYVFGFGEHWRWMLGIGIIPALIMLSSLCFLPESPRWLIAKGHLEEAQQILQRVRLGDVTSEFLAIREVVTNQRGSWRLLCKSWLLPAVFIGFGIAMLQQLVGINSIIYFVPVILMQSGFSSTASALLATMGVGTFLVIFTVLAMMLLDRWGRRPLMLLGLLGMTLSCFALSLQSFITHTWYLLAGIITYVAAFAISLGPIGWLIISEIFPLRIRGFAASLAAATIWGFNILVTGTFLPLVNWLSLGGTFLVYAIICLVGLILAVYGMPETNGVSLERIEHNLRQGKSCRNLGAR